MCPSDKPLRSPFFYTDYLKKKKRKQQLCNQSLVTVTVLTWFVYYRVSHPPTIILPLHNWEPKDQPTKEEEVGPLVEHIYEVKIMCVVTGPLSAPTEFLNEFGLLSLSVAR